MLLQDWWFTTLLGTTEALQPPLKDSIKTDVVIVGAGASGLAAALRLANSGKKIVLVERNICGGSSTGKSAGFLTPDSELELSQLMRRYGEQGAKDIWAVPTKGIELMLAAMKRYNIECDLIKQDSLFLGKGRTGWNAVVDEVESRTKLGFSSQLYNSTELRTILGSTRYSGAVRYPDTYGVNALLYSQGIKKALLDAGVQIFESTEVTSVEGHTVRTRLGSVTADQIIFCADKLHPSLSKYAWNVYHAQTFLSISEPLPDPKVTELFPEEPFQCWDSSLIYSYFRLTGSNRLLLGGGSLFSTYAKNDTWTSHIIDRVIRGVKKEFPCLRDVEFIQFWPGRIDMTRDLLPTVVKDTVAPWVHYVLGCVGLPWATFCGDFVSRRIIEITSSDEDKYYRYFNAGRRFLLPLWLERLLGKRIVFTLNNCWAKYYQVDKRY